MPAGSVWGRSHLERGTSRYNGSEQKHMPVNAVIPNPLRQPRATMSLLVPLSSALGLSHKCLVWPLLTFLGGRSGKIYLSMWNKKSRKACERVQLFQNTSFFCENWPFLCQIFSFTCRDKKLLRWEKRGSLKRKVVSEMWTCDEWNLKHTASYSITGGGS